MILRSILLLLWINWVVAEWKPRVKAVKASQFSMFESFDDSEVMLAIQKDSLQISKNSGENWDKVKSLQGNIKYFEIDYNFPGNRAFAYDFKKGLIFETTDKGENWSQMNLPLKDSMTKSSEIVSLTVTSNPLDEKDLLANVDVCSESEGVFHCTRHTYLSNNAKDFRPLEMPGDDHLTPDCRFLGLQFNEKGKNNIICEARHGGPGFEPPHLPPKVSLYLSDDGGKSFQYLEQFKDYNVRYLILTSEYAVVATAEDKFNEQSVEQLWISQDGQTYEKAVLPTNVRGPYFISELSASSKKLLLQDLHQNGQKGTGLMLSGSDGLRFAPVSSFGSDEPGYYMVSSLAGLEGVSICSFDGISPSSPQLISKISFDDGKTWSRLRLDDPSGEFSCDPQKSEACSINSFFLSTSMLDGNEPATPGVSFIVGFVGDLMAEGEERPKLQTFATRDGGQSWRKILDFPAAVQYGDHGNIMVAFPYSPESDGDEAMEFYYSLDQGGTWTEYQLDQSVVLVAFASTTRDGSGSKFLMRGGDMSSRGHSWLYSIDFSDAFEGQKCLEDDMEEWYANSGGCIRGAQHKYQRRKADAKCLINEPYKDLDPELEICKCTDLDYECTPEFYRADDGTCQLDFRLLESTGSCKAAEKGEQLTLPTVQLERGNICNDHLEIPTTSVDCTGMSGDDNKDAIRVFENTFDFELKSYQYFNTKEDETVLFTNGKKEVYLSYDSGISLKRLAEKVTEVVFNPYFNTSAYVFGSDNKLHITNDRARSFETVDLPEAKQLGFPLSFHATDADTFIFYGGKNCDSFLNPNCHAVAYITRDGGNTFKELKQGALSCDFVGSMYEHPWDPEMILCLVKEKGSRSRSIVTSTDYFQEEEIVVFENVIGYVSVGEYTVFAVPHENQELRSFATIDGHEFAEAKFPADLNTKKQEAYTVLGSQEGAIFFHLTTHTTSGQEFGALMKSNSNGTSFVTLERAVNRGSSGYVDFEKLEGLEGILVINVVSNAEDLRAGTDSEKKLKSKISFNDGSDWSYLQPPERDSEGKSYSCNAKNKEKCSLNLHGYTERKDQRDTYSSGSALGYLIGVGNVGENLLPVDQCSTFMSVDGGFTWKEIKKGAYQWEYGDRGSVIVLVKDGTKTDSFTYSIDSGKTWKDYKFSNEEVMVEDIITTPQDSAMRFLVIGSSIKVSGKQTKTFAVDFTQSFKRQCNLNSDDYIYHSFGNCLFGHQAEYLVKVNDECYNGAAPLEDAEKIVRNCPCIRTDYECDYNYYKASDGTCKLVEGTTPLTGSDQCEKNAGLVEYFESTGYRKIPLSTCEGGLLLDKGTRPRPCPGYEEEFQKRHGFSRKRLAVVIAIPLLIFIGATWFVYDRGVRRNGGFSRFGEIRLGDEELIEENRIDQLVNSIVKFGVMGFSGLVTARQLTKRGIQNAWHGVQTKFSGRHSGPTYSSLNHDQFLDEADELLAGHDEDANDLASFLENEDNFDISAEEDLDNGVQGPYSDHVDELQDQHENHEGEADE
ncbi:LADA_0F09142g1_1 [Lachancea dasiensis]|uniref:LADA_0F09142g1_1 n=1 Tax=Lachancea dasiensis TaxID=1072105 RepID=A0A1G4JL05_9SACH|nr:LADA_0F09142g1_1 [Lachancea dasiensis]